jgi:hypothetical protein
MLEPYDENLVVEERDEECNCKKHLLMDKIYELAPFDWTKAKDEFHARHKDLNEELAKLRTQFYTVDLKANPDIKYPESIKALEKKLDAFYKDEVYNPQHAKEVIVENEWKDKVSYKPDCEDCHGTGTRRVHYNDKARWDWFQIGGRWPCSFKLKPGTTGLIGDPTLLFDAKEKAEVEKMYKEGWCDIAAVKDIDWEATIKKDGGNFSSYAVVDQFGEWHEPGRMGWWGMTDATDESQEVWAKEFFDKWIKPLLENEPDTMLAMVDCHI